MTVGTQKMASFLFVISSLNVLGLFLKFGPLFGYFRSSHNPIANIASISTTKLEKRIDVVLGIRTWGRRLIH